MPQSLSCCDEVYTLMNVRFFRIADRVSVPSGCGFLSAGTRPDDAVSVGVS